MKGQHVPRFFATLLVASSLGAGCAVRVPPGEVIPTGPPVPKVEILTVAPGPDFVWVDGYWAWQSNAYAWRGGRWERPPRVHARWVRGRWRHSGHGWVWIDGRWR